ncbi:MAG: ABC transporter substrate-binding protein, partial [Nitrososphaerales archaeon]
MDITDRAMHLASQSRQISLHLAGISKLQTSMVIIVVIVVSLVGLAIGLNQGEEVSHEVTYPIGFSDDLGRNITLPHEPRRIVSLIPSATEVVFAVGAGDRVVGVTRYDDFPPELVTRIENGTVLAVGGGLDPSIEAVLELDPDIILIGGSGHMGSKPIIRLEELGFTIISLRPDNIEGILKNMELMGRITGHLQETQKIVQSMRETIDLVESKTKDAPKVRVYVENWHDPIFSVGQGTLQHEMVERAGGINIFSDIQGSRQVNLEAVIAKNPDVIISFNNQVSLEVMKDRPGWSNINAIKDGKVYQLTAKQASPNPRIADSLEQIAMLIHPELFENQVQENSMQLMFSIEALRIRI